MTPCITPGVGSTSLKLTASAATVGWTKSSKAVLVDSKESKPEDASSLGLVFYQALQPERGGCAL